MADEEASKDEGCYVRSPHKVAMVLAFCAGVVAGVGVLLVLQVDTIRCLGNANIGFRKFFLKKSLGMLWGLLFFSASLYCVSFPWLICAWTCFGTSGGNGEKIKTSNDIGLKIQ